MERLEYLRIQADCALISDLRACTRLHSIKNGLNNLDTQQYAIHKRNDAASYIINKTFAFLRAGEASEYLKNFSGEQEDRQ